MLKNRILILGFVTCLVFFLNPLSANAYETRGSSGDSVRHIQQELKDLGYDIFVDGIFGNQTYRLVIDFQTKYGLQVDGVVGPQTSSKLHELLAGKGGSAGQTEPKQVGSNETNSGSKNSANEVDGFGNDVAAFVNDSSLKSDTKYLIAVNLSKKEVEVFEEADKSWSLLKKFQATIGKPSTPTITGSFKVGTKGLSFGQNKGYVAKYYTQINGNYLFHSILYNLDGSILDGRLGEALSLGCVRLAEENAKWIYDNIPARTSIIIR